jgi:hypothetical protein
MTLAIPTSGRLTSVVAVGALASVGAGAVHAAAIGTHGEHRQAVIMFTVVAVVQLAWGALALARPTRGVAVAGTAIAATAIGGWVMAKTAGLSFVDGLEAVEPAQAADTVAAGLAAITLVAIALSFLGASLVAPVVRASVVSFSAVVVAGVTLAGMVTASTHEHAHDPASATGTSGAVGATGTAGATGVASEAPGPHTHAEDAAAHDAAATPAGDVGTGAAAGDAHAGDTHAGDTHPVAEPVPYDPTKPIDLGGVPGVTPEQQAAAENLVAVTLLRLPKWSDPAVAEAAGFRSIGDGVTGVEHFVNSAYMDDGVILDPDVPESLVYDTSGGGRRLVAAMYMLARGTPLTDVPDVGGTLMQWHTHENLCYTAEGKVRGITDANGNCPAGLTKPVPTPMIHVWIESHPCGPFAALEGIGGGTILPGETVLCDHAHGA